VFVEGVRESGGIVPILGVPGLLVSPFEVGVSLCERIERAEGAREARTGYQQSPPINLSGFTHLRQEAFCLQQR
jgi:hypothetical protein